MNNNKKILNNLDNTILEDNGTIHPVVPEKKVFAKGLSFFKYFWVFMIGCVFGTYYEQLLTLIKEGVWVSRAGLIYGPVNPVYGFGAVLAVLCLHNIKDWKLQWTMGGIVGGVFEWIISWLQETIIHTVSWDYSNKILNFDGRTTIPFMCFWGLLFMVFDKAVYPYISKWIEKIPYTFGNIITWILITFMTFNFAITGCVFLRQLMRHNGVESNTAFGRWLDETYDDAYISKIFENMKTVKEDTTEQATNESSKCYQLTIDDQPITSYIIEVENKEKTLIPN